MITSFDSKSVLIPASAGSGWRKNALQERSLAIYIAQYLLGAYIYYRFDSPGVRAAGLGLLFPGAGLTSVASVSSIICFGVVLIAFFVSLFAWLAAGAVTLPILVWAGGALLAGLLAKDTLLEPAAPLWALSVALAIITLRRWSFQASVECVKVRERRNLFLIKEVEENRLKAPQPALPGNRELDIRTLRFIQWFIETGLLPANDWSRHTVIDQFQTAALRYQLYQTVYSLQLYQCHYAPNFSGVLKAACRNAFSKAQSEKVNRFWKWESMWGKLQFFDWNPIKKDNIMVTGYIGLALALYDANTRDHYFRQENCMEFVVSKGRKYKTDFPSIIRAVYDNMNHGDFTLYPCEPHWIYTPCNLFAAAGLVTADRALGTNYGEKLRSRFLKVVEEEFSNPDGSILPIRSKITGWALPGGVGIAGTSMNSVLSEPYLPHIAQRCWALGRRECVKYDEHGKLDIELKHADEVDPGNYQKTPGASRVLCAQAAAEHGDRKLRNECLEQVDTIFHPVEATRTGSLYNKGLSVFMQGRALEARLMDYQDWNNMCTKGVPEVCFQGPLLAEAPFPEVLVAKAWSHDGVGMELVLYHGILEGDFTLRFERLQPSAEYQVTGDIYNTIRADDEGKGSVQVTISGRTCLFISR